MRKIKNTELLRTKLAMTQQEFAKYLGVTRTLLSMHEKEFRSLPTSALEKLANLERIYNNFQKTAKNKKTLSIARHPQLQKHHESAKKSMKGHTAFCQAKKNILQRKLDKIIEANAYAETWWQLLDVLANHQKDKKKGFDQTWLEEQKESALKKMMRYGIASQVKLQATIQLLGVEAEVYNKLHEQL